MTVTALIVAAGKGERLGGGVPKQYRAIGGKPVLRWAVEGLIRHPAVREALFQSLLEPANRQREPWVLDALSLLSHPLRQEHARRFVTPALDELEEIQRTGDIFFPDRWLDAALGGHNSAAAAQDVRTFLESHPSYPPRLRAKILQASDGLFRAARIVDGDGTGG